MHAYSAFICTCMGISREIVVVHLEYEVAIHALVKMITYWTVIYVTVFILSVNHSVIYHIMHMAWPNCCHVYLYTTVTIMLAVTLKAEEDLFMVYCGQHKRDQQRQSSFRNVVHFLANELTYVAIENVSVTMQVTCITLWHVCSGVLSCYICK